MQNNKSYIVLGVSKTGTSLTAGLVNKLGVNLGDNLKKPSKHNPRGYFEDLDVLHAVDSGEDVRQTLKDFIERVKDERYGVKHPRLFRYLKENIDLFDNPHIILCSRDIDSIVSSHLVAMDNSKSPTQTKKEVLEHRDSIAQVVHDLNLPTLNVEYEKWFTSDQLKKLADFIGLPVTEEAKQFIDPNLKHF